MSRTRMAGIFLFSGYAVLVVLLFFLKVWKLPEAGLPDYDCVVNYLAAREMAGGTFTDLFSHASPLLNLFWAGIARLNPDFLVLEVANCLVVLLGTLYLNRFIAKELGLKTWQELGLFLLAGSSVTFTYLSRGLWMEGLGFLCFVLFLRAYWRSFSGQKHSVYWAVFFFALLLTINYKSFLLIPIIVVLEIYQRQRPLSRKDLLLCLGIPALVFLGFCLLGALLGLPLLKYPLVCGALLFLADDHPTRDFGLFNLDVLFYFRYIFSCENPLLLIGVLLAPLVLNLKEVLQKRTLTFPLFLAVFAYCLLAGMSLVQKAPRAILFAYPLFYTLTLLVARHFFRKELWVAVFLVFAIGVNLYNLNRFIYPYAYSNYPELAGYLNRNQVKKVATTVSNKVIPYLGPQTEVKVLNGTEAPDALRKEGYDYLIVDDYYKITGIDLKLPTGYEVLLRYEEKPLSSPILALEHCEFSGFSFKEGLSISDSLSRKPYRLLLVKLK